MTTNKKIQEQLEKIAKDELFIETLETRFSDSLDFNEVSVWGLKEALKKAFELGQQHAKENQK